MSLLGPRNQAGPAISGGRTSRLLAELLIQRAAMTLLLSALCREPVIRPDVSLRLRGNVAVSVVAIT